jgi:DNA-binding XRE family transcriptional regulator
MSHKQLLKTLQNAAAKYQTDADKTISATERDILLEKVKLSLSLANSLI